MVHMKSGLATIVSAKTKYYEKLIISLQIIPVRSNVITVQLNQLSPRKLVLHRPETSVTGHLLNSKVAFILIIIVLI